MTSRRPRASPKEVSAARRQSGGLTSTRDIAPLVERVVAIIEEAQSRVIRTVNSSTVLAAWHIGREIVEFVQRGAPRAESGEQVLEAGWSRLFREKPAVLPQVLPDVRGT